MGFCDLVKAAMGEVVGDFLHDADVGGVLGHGGTFFLSFYNLGMVFAAYIFLLLLIREEDADFGDVCGEEAV